MTTAGSARTAASSVVGVLSDITQTLGTGPTAAVTIPHAFELLHRLVPYDGCALLASLHRGQPWFVLQPAGLEASDSLRIELERLFALYRAQPGLGAVDLSEKTAPSHFRSCLAVPLRMLDQVVGVLAVGRAQAYGFSRDEQELLSIVAAQIAAYLTALNAHDQIAPQPADHPWLEELRRNEAELRDILEHAAIGLHWVGADGTILWANRAELDLLGYTAEEYIGRHIAEFHADWHVIEDILRRLKRSETVHECEARLRCKDGSIKHVLISSNAQWDGDTFVHTRCFTVDITARKRAETRLAEYLSCIQHHFAAYDRDCRYLYVNPKAAEVLGRSADELIGQRIWDLFPEAEGNQYHREMLRVLETGEALASEHYYAPFDRWFVNYFSPTSEGVCVLTLDITERKRAEQALRESEARKAAILETALDCIITIDWQGWIVEFNPAAEQTFGYRREDALGKSLAELIIPPRLREQHRRGLERYLATGEGPVLNRRIELAAIRADGTEFPVELAISPIHLDDKPLFTAHLRDITERKRAEEERAELLAREQTGRAEVEELAVRLQDQLTAHVQLNAALRETAEARDRALAELQQLLRARDEFLSSAAHDLKNPLGNIKGQAQLLQRRAGRAEMVEAAQVARGLASIDASTTRMGALVNELLDIARLQLGQPLELNRRRTDLVALVGRTATEHQQRTERHRIRIEAGTPELVGEWDTERLERVLSNLLDNAVKYSPHGGEVLVTVAEDDSLVGRWAVVAVRDVGLGIPATDLPRIFERFYRGGNVVGRIGGTGIGLTGARYIVESHGGTIAVESQESVGTTFSVRLPLDTEVTDAADSHS